MTEQTQYRLERRYRLLKERAAIREKDSKLYDEELEALAQERSSILNREFEWTNENIAKFREFDTFLRDKMRLCYEKVRDADKYMNELLARNKGFLGGEVQIEGRLVIDNPYDESEKLPDIPDELFDYMVKKANRQAYSVRCSSYNPLDQDDIDILDDAYPFPEGRAKMEACPALCWLDDFTGFAWQDLLNLDRDLFGIEITIDNYF